MWRPKTRQARRVPVRLVSRMAFHSASETSSVGLRLVVPAEFTRICTGPSAAVTSARSCSSDFALVTSQATGRERRPRLSISPAICRTSSARRPVATTFAPARARPLVPPTTTAVRPVRSSKGWPMFFSSNEKSKPKQRSSARQSHSSIREAENRTLMRVDAGMGPRARQPLRRKIGVRGAEFGDGGAAEELEVALKIRSENFDRAGDAGFARCGQTIGIGASDKHGFGAETERLDDIAAPANAAVEQHVHLPVHRGHDFGKGAESGGSALELAAAMV